MKSSSKLQKLEQMVDLKYWVKNILKLWWVFLLIGLICGLAGYFNAKYSKVKYRSHLTFALDDGGGGKGNIINLASELGFSLGTGTDIFRGDNILAIITSRYIIENVLLSEYDSKDEKKTYMEKFLTLDNYYKKNNNNPLHFHLNEKRESFTYKQDSLLKKVSSHFAKNLIKAERPDKKLGIYSLEVTSPDEEFSKKFTDELIAQANQFYIDLRTKKSKKTLEILDDRAEEMRRNLNQSISGKAQAQDVNLNPAFSKAQVPITQQQTNIQVYGTAYAEIFKNREMARFQFLNETPVMVIIDRADYPMEKIRKGKLKTAAIFAISGVFIFFLVLWVMRVYKLSIREENQPK